MSRRRLPVLFGVILLMGAVVYLRDPGWLIGIESGFRPWDRTADGTRFRWTGGHASFFVPSDVSSMTIPIRTSFSPGEWTVPVVITVDDRMATTTELRDDGWQRLTFELPGRSNRRVRRIDIRVARTRAGNKGVAVGETELR